MHATSGISPCMVHGGLQCFASWLGHHVTAKVLASSTCSSTVVDM